MRLAQAVYRMPSLVGWAIAFAACGCSVTRDLGVSEPRGLLPVDERNPILLMNDGAYDNWQGEYAVLLAHGGGPKLVGIVVGTQPVYPDLDANLAGWQGLVAAARGSGLRDVPDPIKGSSTPLSRPANDDIGGTMPIGSEGAWFIVRESIRVAQPYRPLVVATGGRLTDVADAYLLDPTVVERVVVVSSLGSTTAAGGVMGAPNGEMDAWASTIVSERFRYVQVSTWYDPLADVPAARAADVPSHAFGAWISAKRPKILNQAGAGDQVSVEAVGIPGFVTGVERVSSAGPGAAGGNSGPNLVPDPYGHVWLVTQIASANAITLFWQLLGDSSSYHP
jgi:hypothetical protein